jgi:hypothetical protein
MLTVVLTDRFGNVSKFVPNGKFAIVSDEHQEEVIDKAFLQKNKSVVFFDSNTVKIEIE